MSYDEPPTRTDNRIKGLGLATLLNDPPILSSQGEQPLASYVEPLTRTDNRINDPPILSSQGEQPLGELRRATDSYR